MSVIASKEFKKMNMSKSFTKWIRSEMYDQKVTQRQIADALGISQPAISEKLRNNQYTFEDFIIITDMLHASADDLMKLTTV